MVGERTLNRMPPGTAVEERGKLSPVCLPESLRRHSGILTKGQTEPGICFGKTIMSLGRRRGRMAGKGEGFSLSLSTFAFLVFMLV